MANDDGIRAEMTSVFIRLAKSLASVISNEDAMKIISMLKSRASSVTLSAIFIDIGMVAAMDKMNSIHGGSNCILSTLARFLIMTKSEKAMVMTAKVPARFIDAPRMLKLRSVK